MVQENIRTPSVEFYLTVTLWHRYNLKYIKRSKRMKKYLITALSASIIISGISTGFSQTASAKENTVTSTQIEEQKKGIAYDKNSILEQLHGSEFAVALPYKDGIVETPRGYISSVVTNPETNQSFYKFESEIQTYGLKKTIIVYGFRYGGEALSTVLDVVSDDTAKYVKKKFRKNS